MPPELYALIFTGLLAAGSPKPLPEATDLELLEFIGAFEFRGGQWLEPLSLDGHDPENPPPVREERQHEQVQ